MIIDSPGMADPHAFPTTSWELRLDMALRASRVVTVIDPLRFRKVRTTLPVMDLQVDFSAAGWDERHAQHLRDPEGRIVLIMAGNAERKAIALAQRIAAGMFGG